MISPYEKLNIIKSLRFLTNDIITKLMSNKVGICNNPKLLNIYLKENTNNGIIKKGIYAGHRCELFKINNPKIHYCLCILNINNDNNRAYGVLVHNKTHIRFMIIEDYEYDLKYTFADNIKIPTDINITESVDLSQKIQELEKIRNENNRALFINHTILESNIDYESDISKALSRINKDRIEKFTRKQYTNILENMSTKTQLTLTKHYKNTSTIITEDGGKLIILNIDNSDCLVMEDTNTNYIALIPLMEADHKPTLNLMVLLGLVEDTGIRFIKNISYKENINVDLNNLQALYESITSD